ncbi:MAG: FAD-dependent oxidoreductase [Oscillatoriophycideae cyanobacterium NC_groundwater_1537_Pr4_S-0.65um_50_18]|nr:FAD-dependent oxidoreductase [Oscillatoriophycideae cyanobacterium NC_groundwater_1537_Pr4_S-0.65um_50_18]
MSDAAHHVVIVGAGVTGMTLAYLLAQRSIKVTLIEAASSFDRVFRGEGLMPGGLQVLEQMGLLHLLQQLPTRQIHTWEFIVNDRTFIQAHEPESLGLYRPTIISQPLFLEALLSRAQALPCFHFIQGMVQALLRDANERICGVEVRQAESTLAIAADLVIGADGRGSAVRRLANLSLKKRDYDANVLWMRLAAPLPERDRATFYGFIRGTESLGAYTSWDDSLKIAYILPDEQPLKEKAIDWKAIDWASRIAALVPPAFAQHVRANADKLEPPVLLKVVFGCCPLWHRPGVLLLGDAAHPMAPIRAQGINVALRDVAVAVNHLLPILQPALLDAASPDALPASRLAAIDVALQTIQAERQPEILRCQDLQYREQHQVTQICRSAVLQQMLTAAAPLTRPIAGKIWMMRQRQLRFGVRPVALAEAALTTTQSAVDRVY